MSHNAVRVVGIIAIIVMFAIFSVGLTVGAVISESEREQTIRVCIEADKQWVDEECVS